MKNYICILATKHLLLTLLAAVPILQLAATPAPFALLDLPDELIFQCLPLKSESPNNYHDHYEHGDVDFLQDVRRSMNPDCNKDGICRRSAIMTKSDDKVLGNNQALVFLATTYSYISRLCLVEKNGNAFKLISTAKRMSYRLLPDDVNNADGDPAWTLWLDSNDPNTKWLLVGLDRYDPRGEVAKNVLLYQFDLTSKQITRMDELWLQGDYKFAFTRDHQLYFQEHRMIPDPDSEVYLKDRYRFVIIQDGKFKEVKEWDLKIDYNWRYGAIASPDILPRQLLVNLQSKADGINLDAESALPMVNDQTPDDEGCDLGRLGFKKFKLFIGSPPFKNKTTASIDQRKIRVFRQHGAKGHLLTATFTDESKLPLTNDGLGVHWLNSPCVYRTLLPQMDERRPVYCESAPAGQYLSGSPLQVEVPACHVLKRLAVELKKNPTAHDLVIPISGVMTNGDRFSAVARLHIIEGDWDDRFKCKEDGTGSHECDNDDGEHGDSSSGKH